MKKPNTPKTIRIGSEVLEVGTAKKPATRSTTSTKKSAAKPKAAKRRAAKKPATRSTTSTKKRAPSGATAKACLAEVAVRGLVNVSNHLAAGLASHGRPHPMHKGRGGVLVGEIEGEIYGKPAKRKPAKKTPKPKPQAAKKPKKTKGRARKVAPPPPPPAAKPKTAKKPAAKKPKKTKKRAPKK